MHPCTGIKIQYKNNNPIIHWILNSLTLFRISSSFFFFFIFFFPIFSADEAESSRPNTDFNLRYLTIGSVIDKSIQAI